MNNLRNELCFTQEELAVLLGVSRTVITLYEKGLRKLPAPALEKLSRIQLLLTQQSQQKNRTCARLLALQQQHYKKAQQLLHQQAKKAAEQAVRVSMQLNKIRERLQHQENKLQLIQLLMENALPGSRELALLKNLEEQLLYNINHCNPADEFIMAYKLSTLRTCQQMATDMHKGLQRKGRFK